MPEGDLIEKGNIDLKKQPSVKNKETGGSSTVWSMVAGFDGQEVLLTRVSEDGKIMSEKEAIDYFKKTGKHLGKFKTVESANKYSQQLHNDYESGKFNNMADNKAMAKTGGEYKEGDQLTTDYGNGKQIFTLKKNDKGELIWAAKDSNSKNVYYTQEQMNKFVSNGSASPIKTFKYQGINYRLNPNDNKWYEASGTKRQASEGISERINELSKVSGDTPKKEAGKTVATETRTQADIDKGGEFRLGLQNKKTPLAGDAGAKEKTWRDWYDEIVPKDNKAVPTAAKQVASKKAAGAGITPREQQTTAGITTGTTIKDALGKLSGGSDTPLAKQSELYDPESYLAGKNANGKVAKGIDTSKFGGVAEYLPDVFKAALGLAGANEKLPEFKTPQYFTDYETRLREQSTQGLTDAEYAQSMRSADRGYAYDVNNISNFAGGRPGVALANLGRAANTLQDAYGNINVADAQLQRQNLAQYGGAVGTHLQLDQNAFNQKFNVAAQNKMAGAQLAADAMANISARRDFNESYGKGSTYAKYQESLLEGQDYQNSILKYMMENTGELGVFQPNVINQDTTYPNYYNNLIK